MTRKTTRRQMSNRRAVRGLQQMLENLRPYMQSPDSLPPKPVQKWKLPELKNVPSLGKNKSKACKSY
jgi:hypothetical protein